MIYMGKDLDLLVFFAIAFLPAKRIHAL